MVKTFYLIAGANGSGKTTLAKELLANENIPFLNADEIAKELSPNNLESVKITAGKKLLSQLEDYVQQEKSFALETTLSGGLYTKVIQRLKDKGYQVQLIYVFLDNPDLCIERIKVRVKQGGHFIPDDDVRRRYYRSIHNFWDSYKNIVDSWGLYYNGNEKNVPIATGENNIIDILDEILYNEFMKGYKNDQ
ncbi:MAG: hypothetical protein E7014_05220 [Alphaproteobacteria bacterium]|nr:hypothetical protein [Alphaproteobacteria bacterium]